MDKRDKILQAQKDLSMGNRWIAEAQQKLKEVGDTQGEKKVEKAKDAVKEAEQHISDHLEEELEPSNPFKPLVGDKT